MSIKPYGSESSNEDLFEIYTNIDNQEIENKKETIITEKSTVSLKSIASFFEKLDRETSPSKKSLKNRVNENEIDMDVSSPDKAKSETEIMRKRGRIEIIDRDIEAVKKLKHSDHESLNSTENEKSIVTTNLLSNPEDLKNKTYTWPNGNPEIFFKYEGSYLGNKCHGYGFLSSPQGHIYEGQFDDGEITGKGTYTVNGNVIYVGDFVNGQRHGKGIQKYNDGGSYEGDFKDGKQHGKGILKYSDGRSYEGDFKDGKQHGKIDKFISGRSYEGDFVDDDWHGVGTLTCPNGNVYKGDFVDGKQHGKGSETFGNGNSYVGDFANGDWHGKGIYKDDNGNVYEGDIVDGKRHGKGKITYLNGDKYIGEVRFGKKQGKGIYLWANGSKYEGQFPVVFGLILNDVTIPVESESEIRWQNEQIQWQNNVRMMEQFPREGLEAPEDAG